MSILIHTLHGTKDGYLKLVVFSTLLVEFLNLKIFTVKL